MLFRSEKLYGKGIGKNQKLAEAEAAKLALELLQAEAKQPKVDAATVAQKLRELSSKNKVPSAEYRDLGETENSNINVKEYAIECRFMGKTAEGRGLSKQDARVAAGLIILDEIEKEKAEEKKALAKAQGKGAISLRGKMIDAPIVARAERTIAMAEALGMAREVE